MNARSNVFREPYDDGYDDDDDDDDVSEQFANDTRSKQMEVDGQQAISGEQYETSTSSFQPSTNCRYPYNYHVRCASDESNEYSQIPSC